MDKKKTKLTTRLTVLLNAGLSRWLPDQIISCSQSATQLHAGIGYPRSRMILIPNGFDLTWFKPDASARDWLRRQLGLPPHAHIIGHVARFDPQKDYPTLLGAAEKLVSELPDTHWALCGRGVDAQNEALNAWIAERGLTASMHLLGQREDIPRITAGFDLATLTSAYGEAFPNVVGEAMACGVPCVVTDVGDSAEMIGDTGKAVPPGDTGAIAQAWRELLVMPACERKALGSQARERVSRLYSIEAVSVHYMQAYQDLLNSRRHDSGHANRT